MQGTNTGKQNGVDTFLDLLDTPNSFSGQANKFVKVNAGATDLEFVASSAGSAIAYIHTQGSATLTWVITHSLGSIPLVQILDSVNEVVYASIDHVSINECRVYFNNPIAGKAFLII